MTNRSSSNQNQKDFDNVGKVNSTSAPSEISGIGFAFVVHNTEVDTVIIMLSLIVFFIHGSPPSL